MLNNIEKETQDFLGFIKERGRSDQSIEDYKFKLETTLSHGESFGNTLEEIFETIGFKPELVTKQGAICFDVYYGNEVVALRRFNPKKLIVTESSSFTLMEERMAEKLYDDGEIPRKIPVLRILGAGMNFEHIDHSLWRSVEILEERKTSGFGLVTWLNVWPVGLEIQDVDKFISKSLDFISSDGLILISGQAADIEIRDILKEVTRRGVHQGCEINYFFSDEFNIESKIVGKYFLTVTN